MGEKGTKALDLRRIYPIKIVWVPYVPNREVPLFFDEKIKLMEEFSLYALYMAKQHLASHDNTKDNEQAYLSEIQMVAYSLKSFCEYLRVKGKSWKEIEDCDLEEYMAWELANVKGRGSSRTEKTAQETVNRKLRVIYQFYWWAQEIQALMEGWMGWPTAPIRSKLPDYIKDPEAFDKKGEAKKTIYPLCFRRTGARSKHKRQHYATDDELNRLRRYFREFCNPLTAERNILIVDIIEHVGWRCGSVRSLLVEHFSEEIIDAALVQGENEIQVTPPEQKFGYQTDYDVKIQLAIRIANFINDVRKPTLERLSVGEEAAQGHLFISFTNGSPLGNKRISRIIADGFKAIGLRKGSGGHSIRRKYGKETATETLQVRQKLGFSNDPASVLLDLMPKLGHSAAASHAAYTHGKEDMYKGTIESQLREQVAELQGQLAQMQLENARLQRSLNKLCSTSR